MGIKYKLHESISKIIVAGVELNADKDGIIDVPEETAAHPEFHRVGKELAHAGKISLHQSAPRGRKSSTEE